MKARIFATFAAVSALGAFGAGQALAQDVVVVPDEVDRYVTEQPYDDPVVVDEDVVVGQELPDAVVVRPVPEYDDYAYAVVNRHRVIIEPSTRRIIRVYE
jgi:hypothetical protein